MSELTTTNNQTQAAGTGLFKFGNFAEVVEAANILANSDIVPEAYRAVVVKKSGYGDNYREARTENPNAVANCLIALNMSNRMGADPLMIMQNLYLIEGRPAWSSTFIIAGINSCGRFGTLNFEFKDLGNRNIEYQETSGYGKNKKYFSKTANVNDFSCVAWAIDKETGNRVESSPITLELAIKEGWYFKRGSKWPTMPEQMAKYRAAAFFGRLYAPEVMMGIYTKDEVEDFTQARDVTPPSAPIEQPQIEYIDDEQVNILTNMINCITNPSSIDNIKKAIPDVRLIPAARFDYYQNRLKATIDTQIIQDEQASYAQQQNTQSIDPNDYVEAIADDGGQYNVYDNKQETA